jgi:hypothetical protein
VAYPTQEENKERRHGAMKPVIHKALVKLDAIRSANLPAIVKVGIETSYLYPGPIHISARRRCATSPADFATGANEQIVNNLIFVGKINKKTRIRCNSHLRVSYC